MTDPVSRTLLLLDIEGFSERDDIEQAYLRRMLYDVADRTLDAAGIEGTQHRRADRGDSVMELIDANASVPELLRALISETPAQLAAINRMAASTAQIRLRAVVATGYVAVDEADGWVGSDLNHACRLLDSALLRDALRERAEDLALCVSAPVYQGIVRHGHPRIPRERFHAVTVESKNGPLDAWLYGAPPTGARAAEVAEVAAASTAGKATSSEPASGGTPAIGGSLVTGNQYGVSGGTVHGNVSIDLGGGER